MYCVERQVNCETIASDKSEYREEFWINNIGYSKLLKKHKIMSGKVWL